MDDSYVGLVTADPGIDLFTYHEQVYEAWIRVADRHVLTYLIVEAFGVVGVLADVPDSIVYKELSLQNVAILLSHCFFRTVHEVKLFLYFDQEVLACFRMVDAEQYLLGLERFD